MLACCLSPSLTTEALGFPPLTRPRTGGAFLWSLARLVHKNVEGFRIDAVLFGGEVVLSGAPL